MATLIPVLAILGVINAGLDMRDAAARDPGYAARYGPPAADSLAAQEVASVARITDALQLAYLGLVAGTFGLRVARRAYGRRFRAVNVGYPGGRVVTVPLGFSVLEASRWAAIPHAAACGGRGRCSTCRVRVIAGGDALPPPQPAEQVTLNRIRAALDVRLACQIRPTADIQVEPPVATTPVAARGADRFTAAAEGGAALQIAAMLVDLRQSTPLPAGRLPSAVRLPFHRYIQAVTGPIRQYGGHVTSIAGDGVMSMFGAERKDLVAAMDALRAALGLWERLDALNHELATVLDTPLEVGIGIHVGVAVVGRLPNADVGSLQFLGDVGNVAAKLEGHTKQVPCTLVVSIDALTSISPDLADKARTGSATIAGWPEPIAVAVFRTRAELEALVAGL